MIVFSLVMGFLGIKVLVGKSGRERNLYNGKELFRVIKKFVFSSKSKHVQYGDTFKAGYRITSAIGCSR